MRYLVLLFGGFAYVVFLFTFLYQIGFVGNFLVPKGIDDGEPASFLQAAFINVALLAFFAVQHTVMARLLFKRWWTTIVSKEVERSIYVLAASLILLLMNWQWRPMPQFVWHIENALGRILVFGISFAGWGLVLYSTLLINHFDLFGLRQVWLYFTKREYIPVRFKETLLYRLVRHPLMLGFIIAFWATPDMTQGHLLFAVVTTGYILVAIQIEERTLIAIHGDEYLRYRRRVSMLVPLPPKPVNDRGNAN